MVQKSPAKAKAAPAVPSALKDAITSLPYQELLERQDEIQARLKVIAIEPIKAKKPPAASSGAAAARGGSNNNNSRDGAAKRAGNAPKKRTSKNSSGDAAAIQDEEVEDDNNYNQVPLLEKTTDVHWDFTMKEMMWLATDFQAERKRQMSLAKKIAAAIRQYHKTRESRRLRELAEAELKRRRLAGKIGREVRGWWTKIERVIAYKQKCSADEERRKAMNKQLVTLVKQTEKYTESLIKLPTENVPDDDDDMDSVSSDSSNSSDGDGGSPGKQKGKKSSPGKKHKRKKRRKRRRPGMTIEEALAVGERSRRSKNKVVDYNRLHLKAEDNNLYGESTASDTGSDNSYSLDESDDWTDDESTLLEAEIEETRERLLEQHNRQLKTTDEDLPAYSAMMDTTSFTADPRELRILQEERDMPIEQVLERYRTEAEATPTVDDEDAQMMEVDKEPKDLGDVDQAISESKANDDSVAEIQENQGSRRSSRRTQSAKKVSFASTATKKNGKPNQPDQSTGGASVKYDADDDGDASDVEDYEIVSDVNGRNGIDDDDDGGSDEFEADQDEVDDETTIAQEERMPQDMSAEQELALLKAENEMSVEELRKLYAGALGEEDSPESENNASKGTAKEEAKSSKDNGTEIHDDGTSAKDAQDMSDDAASAASAGDDSNDGSEEFQAVDELDDERTMEQEESLPQEMSAEEELKLLKSENEMSVEELRARYAAAFESPDVDGEGSDDDDDDDDDSDDNIQQAAEPAVRENGRRSKRLKVADESSLASGLLDAANDTENGSSADEFEPEGDALVDDETTMEAEERLGRDMSYEDEIALLNKENDMSVEELRAKYLGAIENESSGPASSGAGVQKTSSSTILLLDEDKSAESDAGETEDDAEFVAEGDEVDDETTLEAEERLGREMSPEEELAMLQRESETPIESLYEMHQKMEAERLAANAGDNADEETGATKRKRKRNIDEGDDEGDGANGTKRTKEEEESDEGLAAMQALEESAERARKTLATRPFLLVPWVKLREYQQTGLNWLVSLQTRRLNGILADEMGLGKTLQTIALLAYLASYKGIWGPHLVIVPTSVIVNWETELKRFCPGLKALCYYGSAKRRKELRSGWTKTNWYHVVVTSYQLAVQDAFAFKRKRWYYLILDEAQNIKNFQSQRWQTLINFNTQRRLLLTGTPLQNNLMELWSLLHFLMPYIFRSRKEFSFWFSNPMNSVIEGTANQNEEMIARLHGIIRPFVLRRLKKDVETQLPGKFEHIVKCPLSRRQMFFYEEYMARSSTRQSLKKGGNYMGMMNVLMQLRKVCNHPDLFEPRSVVTPFVLKPITMPVPECVVGINATKGAFERLSDRLVSPLWCGSGAVPSVPASCDHDQLRSMALGDLEDCSMAEKQSGVQLDEDEVPEDIPRALADLLKDLNETSRSDNRNRVEFQQKINSERCRSLPFPCSLRLQQALHVRPLPIYDRQEDFLTTPSHLLAMRRNQQERADSLDEMVKNFVFCVPKAGASRPTLEIRTSKNDTKTMEEVLLEPIEECLLPFRKAHARLTSFFPDKKLVQFDAGKLQTLAELLHKLKRGGHRVLIFTQMSKMLDILEAFLNLNGHTYVRLDGSTGVDRRQRLMDRFNNDEKIFTFILSTRSGGMGINLTGADTVIFYDSDWNPAMDAQAQDRAHRIGQTREVHIYRLITEHSIEENILVKAQQKRNLDIIVMDKGKFDGSTLEGKNKETETDPPQEQSDVFTKGGLRAILGVDDEMDAQGNEEELHENENDVAESLTKEQIEAAMVNLEDKDDVVALRGAQKEAAEELREFDETVELQKDSDNEGDEEEAENKSSTDKAANIQKAEENVPEEKNEEDEMVKEFATWQDNVGLDTSALVASLSPTETYGFHFRQDIDPFYSVFAIMEERRRLEALEETKEELDIDQIEHEKAMEERRAIDDGDLLGTRPKPEELVRQRNMYIREKARLKANKKRRTLTGENWELREDSRTNAPFWYNTDTGEALWDKPTVLLELEAEGEAREKLWSGLPIKPLVHMMSFLVPYPDRIQCSNVCRQWRLAATDVSFVRHVYPVEMGALARDDKRLAYNHFRTITEALSIALPGDTIELGDGHYWVNHPGLTIDFPLKLVGDENNASNVVIEMSGTVVWQAKAGWVEGVTFRRPKISSGEGSTDIMLSVTKGGRLDMIQSVIDNSGSSGASAAAIEGSGSKGRWQGVIVKGGSEQGIKLASGAKLELEKCIIRASRGNGITSVDSELHVSRSSFALNDGFGATFQGGTASFLECKFDRNGKGTFFENGSNVSLPPPAAEKRG